MRVLATIATVLVVAFIPVVLTADDAGAPEKKKDFPELSEVTEGFELVVSARDGATAMYKVWKRTKDAQLLAQLPKNYEKQKFSVVPTVAGGDSEMGVYSRWHREVRQQAPYVYWKRFDKHMALLAVNLDVRTRGDQQSQDATARVQTDRVLLKTPIVAMGGKGRPVIDLDDVLVKQSGVFFNRFTQGADFSLSTLDSVKAFPHNIEVTVGFPRRGGRLVKIHYSLVVPPQDTTFEKRIADRRVGFFYTDYTDRAKNDGESPKIRYAQRWNLQKADPSLKLSPPKHPIIFHIEHTTPIRYRRWVREGILAWNRAFERVGILNAIEVYQQDKASGAYMDRDPEDSRYSFVRWTNAGMGFAIGPIHVNPETGQIFEADIVMDEGFISGWARDHLATELASAAMTSFDTETVRWLDENPRWDPRYRLARPQDQQEFLAYQAAKRSGTESGMDVPPTLGPDVWRDPDYSALGNRLHRACMHELTTCVADVRLALDASVLAVEDDDSLLDGLPESFVGPLLKDVIMHEVGHTMGLMHNWRGSSCYSYAQINSSEFKGQRPSSTTVMDYLPTNILVEDGELIQGDYMPIDIGPYDLWAIEWGYTQDDPDTVLEQAARPEHAFVSDEGQSGPDPRAKVWDIGENSLDYADSRMRYVHHVRTKLLDDVVEDGESWAKARRMYGTLLSNQIRACGSAAHWIGGAYFNRNVKGDPLSEVDPIVPVPVARQKRALEFILTHAFRDDSFGLNPEILSKLGTDQWFDERGFDQPDMAIHDQILGVQASAMTMVLNPTRLRRVLDNEIRTPADQEALTLPEILATIREEVWSELAGGVIGPFSARKPMISSLRRNLQREHLDRLIDLATGRRMPGTAGETLASLARGELRTIHRRLSRFEQAAIDAYSRAHVDDSVERIERALEASYIRRR